VEVWITQYAFGISLVEIVLGFSRGHALTRGGFCDKVVVGTAANQTLILQLKNMLFDFEVL